MSIDIPDIIRSYLDAYNARDVPAMLALMTDDVRFENATNQGGSLVIEGKAALAELAEQSAAAFSERGQTVRDAVVTLERVVLDIDFEARVAIDMQGGWKAGETVKLRGVSFYQLRGNLIAGIVDFS
jgi:steroid delta-isomerase-like uncharacterized protein